MAQITNIISMKYIQISFKNIGQNHSKLAELEFIHRISIFSSSASYEKDIALKGYFIVDVYYDSFVEALKALVLI